MAGFALACARSSCAVRVSNLMFWKRQCISDNSFTEGARPSPVGTPDCRSRRNGERVVNGANACQIDEPVHRLLVPGLSLNRKNLSAALSEIARHSLLSVIQSMLRRVGARFITRQINARDTDLRNLRLFYSPVIARSTR